MPALREETKLAMEKGQSMNRWVVPQCEEWPPKVTWVEEAKSQGKKAIEENNRKFTEPLGEFDLPGPMALHILFLTTIN